ncbi:MAG: hypothetical protein U9Q78_01305 [Chloroflexota bacterium]|nr:hypothetical protein [Chloroflexota bacterium]
MEEQVEERAQVPPFYDRFQEEGGRRFSSEIARLEGEVRHNGESIARLDDKIDDVRADLKADIARLDNKIDDVRAELKADIARLDNKIEEVRAELKADIARLDVKMDSHFRWMLALILPIILGVVAILVQNLVAP